MGLVNKRIALGMDRSCLFKMAFHQHAAEYAHCSLDCPTHRLHVGILCCTFHWKQFALDIISNRDDEKAKENLNANATKFIKIALINEE